MATRSSPSKGLDFIVERGRASLTNVAPSVADRSLAAVVQRLFLRAMDAEVSSALDAVLDEQRVVTFRYLAQHHGMPVEKAKKALQAYAKAHAGSVHALYMVGGARGGDAGGLEFKLVPEAEVEGAAADYEGSLLARHVYSLHAAAPEGASAGEAEAAGAVRRVAGQHGQHRDDCSP